VAAAVIRRKIFARIEDLQAVTIISMAISEWPVNQHITRGGINNINAFKGTAKGMHEEIILRLKRKGILPKIRECDLHHQ
jgi:hypothetical protein